MDNIFEVLIYLIIIISFLSSLFKKKETPKSTHKSQTSYKRRDSDAFSEFDSEPVEVGSSGYDILTEIENIFNQDLGKPKTENQSTIKTEEKVKIRSLEQESINYDSLDLEKKSALETQKRFQRKDFSLDSRTEKAVEMFEELLNKQKAKTYSRHRLVKKIKSPQMIKDYILVAEILNKPLSLRK